MKVLFCPSCLISPNITATEVKCPKCGKTANGENLTETVTRWNDREYSAKTEPKAEPKVEETVEKRMETPRRRRKRSE